MFSENKNKQNLVLYSFSRFGITTLMVAMISMAMDFLIFQLVPGLTKWTFLLGDRWERSLSRWFNRLHFLLQLQSTSKSILIILYGYLIVYLFVFRLRTRLLAEAHSSHRQTSCILVPSDRTSAPSPWDLFTSAYTFFFAISIASALNVNLITKALRDNANAASRLLINRSL